MLETVAGVRVDRQGAGSPIWLFHSLLADAGSCAPLADRLRDEFEVFLPDLPGFGGSAACDPALSAVADRMADAIRATSGAAAVFGNGYGGFVALTLALRHPELVTRLILAGTAATFPEAGAAQFRAMQAGARAKGLAAIADVAMLRLFPADVQARLPEIMADRRARFLATDLDVFTGACGELAGFDLRDRAASLTLPALLMAGDGDQATPAELAEQLAGLMPNARFKLLDGCAHVPQLQDPDRIAAEIREFRDRSTIEMFGFWRSAASFRVRMALNVKGLAFNETMIDLDAGEQTAPAFAAMNPQAKVPLVTFENGVRLTQSMAILEYLDETHPAPPLLPRDAAGRARVRALAGIWAADHHPLIVPRIRNYLRDVLGADEAQRTAWIQHWFSEGLRMGEAALADDPATGTFCHGDALSIADLCLMSHVAGAKVFQVDVAPYPTIGRITQSCLALDAITRALPLNQPGAPGQH